MPMRRERSGPERAERPREDFRTEHGRERRRSALLVRALAENVRDQVVVLEALRGAAGDVVAWRYVDANASALELLGRTRAEVIGRRLDEIVGELRPEVTGLLERVLATGQRERHEARYGGHHLFVTLFRLDDDTVASAALDVTEQDRAQATLRQVEERAAFLARFPEENPDPVMRLDRTQTVLYANEAARSRLRALAVAVGAAAPTELAAPAREAAGARRSLKAEVRCGEATFAMRFVPVEDEVNVYAQDITARVQAEQALRDASRRKDEFLAMLSHELRNPLAPIANSVFILGKADPASEAAVHAREVIERQTRHLTRLVDDLLDVTRIARGKVELRRARIDLREVVSRAAGDFRVLMQDRGLAFEIVLPEGELWAIADGTRIAQIVGNLLHNAAKFTRRGGRVALILGAAGGRAELRVRDTGVGVAPELLPHLFDPFVQGDRTLARTDGGLGLGLALVKGIAELHGGAARVERAGRGEGAEFVVSLPLSEGP